MQTQQTTAQAANWLLWFIFLGGPVTWLVGLQTDYALVPWVCTYQKILLLRLVACAFLIIPALIVVVAWRHWRRQQPQLVDPSSELVRDRARFMSLLGLMSASIFFLVILAQAVSTFIFDPCAT
jgi:hypothetical protein